MGSNKACTSKHWCCVVYHSNLLKTDVAAGKKASRNEICCTGVANPIWLDRSLAKAREQ